MTPAEAVVHAAAALDLAQHDDTGDSLYALHRALLTLANVFEVTGPADLPTVATWYALDAAAAVRDAAKRHDAPRRPPLTAAEHAVLTARAALDVATLAAGGPCAPA
jgi:hypothetical protein